MMVEFTLEIKFWKMVDYGVKCQPDDKIFDYYVWRAEGGGIQVGEDSH